MRAVVLIALAYILHPKEEVLRSGWIKVLLRKGLLIEGPKYGRSRAFRLSLDVGWKASAKDYNENIELSRKQAAKDLAKERWKVFKEIHEEKTKN